MEASIFFVQDLMADSRWPMAGQSNLMMRAVTVDFLMKGDRSSAIRGRYKTD